MSLSAIQESQAHSLVKQLAQDYQKVLCGELQQHVRIMLHQLNSSYMEIQKFIDGVKENPAYALSWANNVHRAAARIEIYGQILHTISQEPNQEMWNNIKKHAMETVLHRACSVPSSTSVMSNVMDMERLAVWSDFVRG